MKKKLLMAAVGAALVAGPTVAVHAATTLYGHFHMSFDRTDNDSTVSIERSAIESSSSRFGIKGDEDVGGGLKVLYQVEGPAFSADQGSGGFGGTLRNTFVGASGGFGKVIVGRHDTPFKQIGYVTNSFIEQVGDARNVLGNPPGVVGAGWNQRVNNVVRYDSPSFGGANLALAYTGNNGAESSAASTALTSATLIWKSGPLLLGAGYESHALSAQDETGVRLVGKYDFGMFTLAAQLEQLTDLGGVSGADRKAIGLLGSVKVGANTALELNLHTADELDNAPNTGGSLIAIGLQHNLSKLTQVYFNIAKADNDSATTGFNVAGFDDGHGTTGLPSPTTAGASPTGMSAGVIINF